jgi:hypothetical protein
LETLELAASATAIPKAIRTILPLFYEILSLIRKSSTAFMYNARSLQDIYQISLARRVKRYLNSYVFLFFFYFFYIAVTCGGVVIWQIAMTEYLFAKRAVTAFMYNVRALRYLLNLTCAPHEKILKLICFSLLFLLSLYRGNVRLGDYRQSGATKKLLS